jgi:hypothetical protein
MPKMLLSTAWLTLCTAPKMLQNVGISASGERMQFCVCAVQHFFVRKWHPAERHKGQTERTACRHFKETMSFVLKIYHHQRTFHDYNLTLSHFESGACCLGTKQTGPPAPARISRKLPWKICQFFRWKRIEQIHSQGVLKSEKNNFSLASRRVG